MRKETKMVVTLLWALVLAALAYYLYRKATAA